MLDLKTGSFRKVNNEVAEVVNIKPRYNIITFRTVHGDITGKEDDLKIESIPIEQKMLVACCGFDENGLLKIDIDGREFYLQEYAGYIIWMT